MAESVPSRRISVLDTTLRDGEQAPGNAMLPEQKLELALLLEDMGVDCVEVAFPASSALDAEATRLVAGRLSRARLATFSRTRREDVEIAVEAAGVENHELQMVATGSDLHLEHKRGITRAEAVAEVADAVSFASSLGAARVSVGIEDASRSTPEFMRALTETAVESGASCVILADTTGCATPSEFGELIAAVRSWAPPSVSVSCHCHDDLGLAVANTLAGIEAGADEVQLALGGIGERAGNTSLEEVAALLAYKGDRLGVHTGIDLSRMYHAYGVLRAMIGLAEPRTKAIFGQYAFSTAAGIHQQGMLANPATYEYIEPERFGRDRALVVGRHSGRAMLRHLLDEIGVEVDDERMADLYREHIAERPGGDCADLTTVRERLAVELLRGGHPVGSAP